MGAYADLIGQLSRNIEEAVLRNDWEAAENSTNVLAEALVSALFERDDDDIRRAFDSIEDLWTFFVAVDGSHEGFNNAASAAGEFRAYTRLLGTALQYKKPAAIDVRELSKTARDILKMLHANPGGLANRALAVRTNAAEESVSRTLKHLRSLRIVNALRVGKATINTLTTLGSDLAASLVRVTTTRHAHIRQAQPRQNPEIAVDHDLTNSSEDAGTG